METKLERISQLSEENPDMVFTSIGHLIDKELLKQCHVDMDGTKAVGIDGITKEDYGANLEKNLDALVERLKGKTYKPQPARRVEIPKDNGKTRPLSIYCYEDKLVQDALPATIFLMSSAEKLSRFWFSMLVLSPIHTALSGGNLIKPEAGFLRTDPHHPSLIICRKYPDPVFRV